MTDTTKPVPTGIKSVNVFRDGAGRCCDRCGTFIKIVALVAYKDGITQSYGSECINKILSGDNRLVTLWKQNARRVQHYQACLEILNRHEDQLPLGKQAVNDETGAFRFIADEKGSWMTVGSARYPSSSAHMLFVPTPTNIAAAKFTGAKTFDMRDAGRTCWEPWTLENWQFKCRASIEDGKAWLQPRSPASTPSWLASSPRDSSTRRPPRPL